MAESSASTRKPSPARPLPKTQYRSLLEHLRAFVGSLSSSRPKSYWTAYAASNTYSDAMRGEKLDFVRRWASQAQPRSIIDIGGNTGDFSLAALESGAVSLALVVDSDVDAVEQGYLARRSPALMHLVMNMADPSPDMGWRQAERQGLSARARQDGAIALAVIHHMVIGGNLPLPQVVEWLVGLAPKGVIEFVPKTDPMVAEMLLLRDDIFPDYTEENFLSLVSAKARITERHRFAQNGRLLVSYERLS
jgi:ribosomal protein L11 methylase PrmA